MKPKAVLNWSSGKDAAFALYKIQQEQQLDVIALLTSINSAYDRVSMHGVRTELLEEQALLTGIPLVKLCLPENPSMEVYQSLMKDCMENLRKRGITHSIYGDILLEDLRAYRESKLEETGFTGVFPLWKRNTLELAHEFIHAGFRTIVTCVNETFLDKSFAGRIYDENFLAELPDNVDPCGENGEFHTFTFDGPIFRRPVAFSKGELIRKTYPRPEGNDNATSGDEYVFWFCDLKKKPEIP